MKREAAEILKDELALPTETRSSRRIAAGGSRPEVDGRVHQTLRVTPAMEAGIADHIWSIEEIVGLIG